MSSFSRGQRLMTIEPSVYVLKDRFKTIRCDKCFVPLNASSLITCKCNDYYYCTRICADDDWNNGHCIECRNNLRQLIRDKCESESIGDDSDYMKFRDSDEIVTHSLLLIRLIYKLINDKTYSKRLIQMPDDHRVTYEDIDDAQCMIIQNIWDDTENCIKNVDVVEYNFGVWKLMVKKLLTESVHDMETVADHIFDNAYRIIVRYTLFIMDMSFINEIGKGFYPEICFIQHSCVPNCGPNFINDTNRMHLQVYSDGIYGIKELRYDYQIEMSGFGASELRNQLEMRNIICKCKKCANVKMYSEDHYRKLIKVNVQLANWPLYEYCKYVLIHVNDSLDEYRHIYGNYHPYVTLLLLWKFSIIIELIKVRNKNEDSEWESLNDVDPSELSKTHDKLINALIVTHGNDHDWVMLLNRINECIVKNDIETAQNIFIKILPYDSFLQKLF